MKNCYILLSLVLSVIFTSCSPKITRSMQYPKMYEEKPVSIVIMPPINQTHFVEAKEYFYTTLYVPLCEKGYYVFSPYLTMEMFQNESAYDSEVFIEKDISIFHKVLGADAAMFTKIKSWKRNNLLGQLTVGVEYILRSTHTGETLYQREGIVTVDLSTSSDDNTALGALVDMVSTFVATASTDKVLAGRACTAYVLSDMPDGKYSPSYGKDGTLPAGEPVFSATVK